MSGFDNPPPSRGAGGRPISKAQIKAMKKGGQRADKIRKKREQEHVEKDLPTAESFLDEALKKLD